ncbi:NUDIX domain-containing protein [Spirosoma linguale]|uniref:NUDIX hydrolase n=1 Tax=Spirosoma linguale (strain ATCC 33905 / DSM 74 / LMG 10896 / Claus 1) TaxID=504472 RepID=D2QT31_SPILD|nr:NUDIX hydrolase [Spirosoma linguale DSM 74]
MEEYIKRLGHTQKFRGKLVEVIDREFELLKNGKIQTFKIEIARRPPGVRLMIIKAGKMLLTREFRSELQDWDYRIAGGKIFDTMDEYLKFIDDENEIILKSIEAVKNEGLEETGIIVKNQTLFYKSTSGATMEWDLYYYIVDEFDMAHKGNETEFAEIIYPEWYSYEEVITMCLDGRIKEDRTIGVLLKYLLRKK